MHQTSSLYKRYRFPGEIISHAVWLYYRFLLSYRDVEELLAERGIAVSYETIRRWCRKFGSTFADRLRRRRPRPGDKWHADEVHLIVWCMDRSLRKVPSGGDLRAGVSNLRNDQ